VTLCLVRVRSVLIQVGRSYLAVTAFSQRSGLLVCGTK